MKRLILILLLVGMAAVAIAATVAITKVPSIDRLRELARAGAIDEGAPVKAEVQVTIHASPEKVWGLLTDIQGWPKWQPDIASSEFSGKLMKGSEFRWSTGGAEIHSQVAIIQPKEMLVWTGTAYQAKAVHVWRLQELPDGQTLVKTEESMDGFLIGLFFSSDKLKENDRNWLNYLKAAAER